MTAVEALAVFLMTAPGAFAAGMIYGSRYPLAAFERKSRHGRHDD